MKRKMATGREAMSGRLSRGIRNTAGNAAIEAAFLAPMLVLLAVAIADYGLSIQRQMQIQHAAQAGADYAMRSGFNAAAIANAVTGATTAPAVAASPPPAETCGCAAGTTITAAACTVLCADGTAAGRYVTVSAQGTYSTLLPYPGIPTSFTFNATAVTRIR